ncbi:Regulator of G-protein signaling 8 [Schistosoma japonicum]|uniref:Regulator of G-protein signaling 8 n=2 Tax=Schistosoma japonicum TaxID=6182 RepID=A0A4Z2DH31_SCHJA|nr:Regulator of G-protein signaling 8 [Schistosoma japonicum]
MADNFDLNETPPNTEDIHIDSNISNDLNTSDKEKFLGTDPKMFESDVMKDDSAASIECAIAKSEEADTDSDVNSGDEMDFGNDADATSDDSDDDDDSDSYSSGSSVARLVQTARNLVQVEKAEQMARETNEDLNLSNSQLTDEEEFQRSPGMSKSDTDTEQSTKVINTTLLNPIPTFIDPNDSTKPLSTPMTTVISAKAAATLGIDLSDKSGGLLTVPYQADTGQRIKSKPKDYFKKKIDKEFIGQLQRANKRVGTPRESIHESLERLPIFDNESKKSTSSQQFRNEKLNEFTRNSISPADFISTSPRHSTAISGIGGKKNKIGFQFFRPKTSVQPGAKLVQVKEIKRMIRAGKPSYEQIHNWGHSFEALLNDKYGLALFKDFLSTEFSDENIEFWIACQDYKHTTNPKKLAIKANQIYTEFIAVQANREVNLDSKTRLQTEADLSNPTVNTLENAQKRIQALMEKDSYRRFLRSEVYLTMLKEARETAKAAATAALAASLQQATDELEEPVFQLVHSTTYTSPFSFLSTFGSTFSAQNTPSLTLPGVAAAAAKADAGMNNIQDLQLLGLSTSRLMRECKQSHLTVNRPVTNATTTASSPIENISQPLKSNVTCCQTTTSTAIPSNINIYSADDTTGESETCDISNNVNTCLNVEMNDSAK